MTQNILDLNEALVSKILYDFDTDLQTRFSPACSSLFWQQMKFQMECFMIRCAASGAMPARRVCAPIWDVN